MDENRRIPKHITEDQVIHCEGPEGGSLFWDLNAPIPLTTSEMQSSFDQMWNHYHGISDHRLRALVGALCIENWIDRLLKGLMPGYESLRQDADFTFSMKIKITRAMKLIPARILASCDLIRKVRNEFAHNLELRSFSQLDAKLLNKFAPHVREFNTAERDECDFASLHDDLVSYCICALVSYTSRVELLREYLETDDFRVHFNDHCSY